MRIGNGLDVHPFSHDADRPLILAGVRIAGAAGLQGHSDGDVVAHAVADALLGAAALGDLGSFFGLDTPELAGADSLELLSEVVGAVDARDWAIANMDITVVAQRPRLSPYRELMSSGLAQALGIGLDRVSVKFTTTDHLGAMGRGEGIAAWASCLLVELRR